MRAAFGSGHEDEDENERRNLEEGGNGGSPWHEQRPTNWLDMSFPNRFI